MIYLKPITNDNINDFNATSYDKMSFEEKQKFEKEKQKSETPKNVKIVPIHTDTHLQATQSVIQPERSFHPAL